MSRVPAPSNPSDAPKSKAIDKGKAVVIEEAPRGPPKKRTVTSTTQAEPSKCPKVTDPLVGEFFSKVAPLIKDVLVQNWDGREEDTAHKAMVRASLKMLFHGLKERVIMHKYWELLGATEEKEKKHLRELADVKKQLAKLMATYDSDVQVVQKSK